VSICDNWPDQLDTLADASIITDVFPLSRVPVIQTIEPWVNGAVRTSGWVYEADGNLIRFTVSPPSSGDLVDIFYTPA